MTIKEFAKLCKCNPQTLRYYDRIALLKPERTDDLTGYRYYNEQQALDFIKIKNFQNADFSIDEIKQMLTMSEAEVDLAFEKKIKEQQDKLAIIKKIHRSYVSEIKDMEQVLKQAWQYAKEHGEPITLKIEDGLELVDGMQVRIDMETGIIHAADASDNGKKNN